MDTAAGAATSVTLRAAGILRGLLAVTTVLLLLHLLAVASYLYDWRFPARDKFYFDAELNIPTVYSCFLLLSCATLLAWIAAAKRRQDDPFRWHWLGLAALFFALTVDEAAALHELLIRPLRDAYALTGWLRFPWVIAGGSFAVVFAIAYLRFLRHLPTRTAGLFLLAGCLYVGGAVGMEMVGGRVFMEEGTPGRTLVPYMVAMTLEELFEMAGAIVFLMVLLQYLRTMGATLRAEVR